MKSIFLLTTFFLILSLQLKSQDIILLRNGEEIKAKITATSEDEVMYKLYDNQTGSTLVINKKEIFLIKKQDGSKETIKTPNKNPVIPKQKPQQKQISTTKRAYFNFNAGYGLKMSSQNIYNFYNYTGVSNSSTYEQVNISLGEGFNLGSAFGYMLNKNFGLELGVSYLLGGKSKAKDSYYGVTTDYTISSNFLRIIPSMGITTSFEKLNPFTKFGLVIGSGSIKVETDKNDAGNKTVSKTKYNGDLAFGLNAALGILYNLSNNLSFFSEINMINLSYGPSKAEITEATYNGNDLLKYMTTSEKEIEYVNSYTYSSTNPTPDTQPSEELKRKYPFGSFGLNIGLRINF